MKLRAHIPRIKSTDCSKPYTSRSQSSLIRAPRVTPGIMFRALIRSSVYSIASVACSPPWGMILPHITRSSRSCTIINPPSIISPSTIAICSRRGHVIPPWFWAVGFEFRSRMAFVRHVNDSLVLVTCTVCSIIADNSSITTSVFCDIEFFILWRETYHCFFLKKFDELITCIGKQLFDCFHKSFCYVGLFVIVIAFNPRKYPRVCSTIRCHWLIKTNEEFIWLKAFENIQISVFQCIRTRTKKIYLTTHLYADHCFHLFFIELYCLFHFQHIPVYIPYRIKHISIYFVKTRLEPFLQ